MSLLSKNSRAILAFGFVGLLILISLDQKISQSGQTPPVEAVSEISNTSYLPAIKISGPNPAVSVDIEPFVTGLQTDTVTEIKHAGDGRLFIVEREGYIRVVEPNGTVLPMPFLDISGPTLATDNWEQGLIGLEFHPNYANNGHFFIAYTAAPSGNIRIMRYTVSVVNPNVANPTSGLLFFDIPKPLANDGQPSKVHNGGSLHFGPDGYLYISIGDGGPDPWVGNNQPGDPYNNSQRMDKLLGKILRIDVNGNTPDCGSGYYSIPPSNPHAGDSGKCDEIWASGLRNPWRMSFDSLTGELYIGDVGEWLFEEINYQPAGSPGGLNYGWHCYEGTTDYVLLYPEIANNCQHPEEYYTFPIFEYPHGSPCSSVTGGYVYRGTDFPEIYGQYLFGDFCTGRIWRTARVDGVWETVQIADIPGGISTFGEGSDGELYVGTFMSGKVYRIVP